MLPGASIYLHGNKVIVIPPPPITANKATFLKAALCPDIPFQGVQVDTLEPRGAENMIEEGNDHVAAMTLIPVFAVAYHDPQLRPPLTLVDIVVHTVADMPDFDMQAVLQAMKHDKKVSGGRIKFVLPKTIGDVFITDEVDLTLVREVLSA